MSFECNYLEDRNADGSIEATALQWTEVNAWFETLMLFVAIAAFIGGGVVTLFGGNPWIPRTPFSIGGSLFLMVSPFLLLSSAVLGTPRALVFHRDGRIAAPLGFSSYPRSFKHVTGTLADIASIEARQTVRPTQGTQTTRTHGVVLFKRNGDIAYVASRLHPDSAHKLAVQMTHALVALREDIMSATIRSAPSHPGRGNTVEILID
jgi:hypothetical protein